MASYDMTSPHAVRQWMESFTDVHIDLGTGNGAYALHMARANPRMAVVGIDTCLDNLSRPARKGLPNLRFEQLDATEPPAWLHGEATSISVNFPFGSLLRVLAEGDAEAHRRLFAVARPGAEIEIRINGSAVEELNLSPEIVRDRLRDVIRSLGTHRASVAIEPHHAFRRFPSTWAKRLAFGRPSQVVVMTATNAQQAISHTLSETSGHAPASESIGKQVATDDGPKGGPDRQVCRPIRERRPIPMAGNT